MNIIRAVKAHLDDVGWPDEECVVGPNTCGPDCRKPHAYAYLTNVCAVYDRPCNVHEAAMPMDRRMKLGLPSRQESA